MTTVEYYVTLHPFLPGNIDNRASPLSEDSGPFSTRASAERALSLALGSGKFAKGTIKASLAG